MSTSRFDLERFFADPRAVAAVARADDVFGFLTRRIQLPPGVAALVSREQGDESVCPPASELAGEGVRELLFIRSEGIDLTWVEEAVASADRFQADVHVTVRVTPVAERGELSSFRTQILGSERTVDRGTLARYLRSRTRGVLTEFAGGRNMAVLIDGRDAGALVEAFKTALSGPCFEAGLSADDEPVLRFESATFGQVRRSQEQAARRRQEHAARRQLEQAIETAQHDHLQHLEGLLGQLRDLADKSPDVEVGDLMRTFSERERGELYEALFAAGPEGGATQWLVVAAGTELLCYEPQSTDHPVRTVAFGGEVGAVRSVQAGRGADGRLRLLAGAARGVYEIVPELHAEPVVYSLGRNVQVRGGFNSVALAGDRVLATHSEIGLACWRRDAPGQPEMLLEGITSGARAVRGVQFHAGRIYFSADSRVLSVDADQPVEDGARVYGLAGPAEPLITALCVTDAELLTGDADGRVRRWSLDDGGEPALVHSGNRRPAESLHVLDAGGIRRLFLTDTSLAVHARVIGDTFSCRYEAGGQTLSRVEVAPDLLVATNEVRDRLILWKPGTPTAPCAVVPVGQQTGHSVQDVCLLPMV